MHFYISDDKAHDILCYSTTLLPHAIKVVAREGLQFQRHVVWLDGCLAQFKSARPFYFVGRFYSLTTMEMVWNYFASKHGKGEHDGASVVVKRALTNE